MIAEVIFVLWLMHNPTIHEDEDIALDAYQTQEACEKERLSGEFPQYFQCLPASDREASFAALLFAKLQNCDVSDGRCIYYKQQQSRIQRMRHPHGLLEAFYNRLVGW